LGHRNFEDQNPHRHELKWLVEKLTLQPPVFIKG